MSPFSHPLNYLNTLFYSCCPEAFTTSGLADFFVTAEPVQQALYQYLSSLFPKELNLLELCSGSRPDRWEQITKLITPSQSWTVTLSDFSPSALPHLKSLPTSPSISFSTEILDLFSPLPPPSPTQLYDLIFTTYGFDSLWFPEDVHYEKALSGDWYKTVWEFPPTLPPGLPPPDSLPQSLSSLPPLSLELLSSFTPIKKLVPIDIAREPYGCQIAKYYSTNQIVSINFPGGLLKLLPQFISTQLKPSGFFITGDRAHTQLSPIFPDFETTGQVARFQTEDYGLAAHLLTESGFKVELFSLSDLLPRFKLSLPLDLSDHLFLQAGIIK
jgi:hypothetical protein